MIRCVLALAIAVLVVWAANHVTGMRPYEMWQASKQHAHEGWAQAQRAAEVLEELAAAPEPAVAPPPVTRVAPAAKPPPPPRPPTPPPAAEPPRPREDFGPESSVVVDADPDVDAARDRMSREDADQIRARLDRVMDLAAGPRRR